MGRFRIATGDRLEDLFDSLGPLFNMYIMHDDIFFTNSPEHIKRMLTTDFPNFVKGTFRVPVGYT